MNSNRENLILQEMQHILNCVNLNQLTWEEFAERHTALVFELNDIRVAQIQELKKQFEELSALYDDHDRRLMELEGIDLLEKTASQFIIENGLGPMFERYFLDQVSKVSIDVSDKPARLQ